MIHIASKKSSQCLDSNSGIIANSKYRHSFLHTFTYFGGSAMNCLHKSYRPSSPKSFHCLRQLIYRYLLYPLQIMIYKSTDNLDLDRTICPIFHPTLSFTLPEGSFPLCICLLRGQVFWAVIHIVSWCLDLLTTARRLSRTFPACGPSLL